ncbi:hypothetical protein RABR111495_12475 [Rahnella bruchi]
MRKDNYFFSIYRSILHQPGFILGMFVIKGSGGMGGYFYGCNINLLH